MMLNYRKKLITCAVIGFAFQTQSATIDWGSGQFLWPDGDLNKTFTLSDPSFQDTDVSITFAADTSVSTIVGNTPKIDPAAGTDKTNGGTAGTQADIMFIIDPDKGSGNSRATVTAEFEYPVTNVSFTISDIDYGNPYSDTFGNITAQARRDKIIVQAFSEDGTPIDPLLTKVSSDPYVLEADDINNEFRANSANSPTPPLGEAYPINADDISHDFDFLVSGPSRDDNFMAPGDDKGTGRIQIAGPVKRVVMYYDENFSTGVNDDNRGRGVAFFGSFSVTLPKPASISGNIKSDEDASGAVSTSDENLAGVTITLRDSNNTIIATTTTNSDGNYTFSNLAPGQYTVEETNPAKYTSVSDTDGTNDDKTVVTLTSGENKQGVDFLDAPNPGVVSGTVFEDALNSAKKIAGVVIKLTDSKGIEHITTTDATGHYQFDNIPSGDFTIVEVDNANYNSITDIDGKNDNTITGKLTAGGSSTGNDFADKLKPAIISGQVTSDDNNDTEGDSPIAGVTIELIDGASNKVIATTTTDTSGNYSFQNVPPGNYQVKETDKATYDSVKDTDAGDKNVTEITLGADENKSGIDFVDKRKPGSISGKVERDVDQDSSGDDPIANVTIELLDDTNAVIAITTTKSDGTYVFDQVPPGKYTVQEKDPADHKSVKDSDGKDHNETTVNVNAGQATTGIDFVDELLPGSISGNVSSDNNGDESGDENLANVTIELINSAGKVIASTTTDPNGNYEFTQVPTGTYTVKETNPNGYESVSDTDANDKDVTTVNLSANEAKTGIDFVDKPESSTITGTITEDINNDKTGDNPLSGVSVELIDAKTGEPVLNNKKVPIKAVTDENGKYLLEEIPTPGNYIIREILPSTHVADHDSDGSPPKETLVSLNAGENKTDVNFVNKPKPGTISGKVTEDIDKDSSGDNPIAGVTIILKDNAGNEIARTTTDSNGRYQFINQPAGNYTVTEIDLNAYTSVSDTDGNNKNVTEKIVLLANGSVSGIDFVDAPKPGTISGEVTEDTDGDKSGNRPIANVTIILKDKNGKEVKRTTTDASGHYVFTNVKPGNYTVTEKNPTGYLSVKDTDGGSSDNTNVSVTGNDSVTDINFVDKKTDDIETQQIPTTTPLAYMLLALALALAMIGRKRLNIRNK